MGKLATFNASGLVTAFYDTAVNPTVPAGAVALTQAQYLALLAAPATTTFSGGALGSTAAFVPALTLAQQALAALGSGLALTSTSHAAVSGTYSLDMAGMSLAADLAGLINANSGAFPGGASTWSWPDASGALHVFPSAATFLAFQKALASYRLALYGVIWGSATSLPTASATIA